MEQMFFPVTKREAERQGIPYSSEQNKDALFPTQLRKLRGEKGVSQDTLSKVIGVSKSTIGLWETGDTLPDAKSVRDLAEYFGVSADFILGLSREKSKDMETRAVCDYTGLSACAVRSLHVEKPYREREFPSVKMFSIRLINKIAEDDGVILNDLAWKAGLSALVDKKFEGESNPYAHKIATMITDAIAKKDEKDIGMIKIPTRDAALFYRSETAAYCKTIAWEIAGEYIEEYIEAFLNSEEGKNFMEK